MTQANLNGYSVIRILQEDIFYNKNNWEENLINVIKKYDIPNNIFLADIYHNSTNTYNPSNHYLSKSSSSIYLT